MKNRLKYILLVVLVIILGFVVKTLFDNNNELEELSLQVETVREIREYDFKKLGESSWDQLYEKYDTVKFGHYMQDKKGKKKIPIEWIVLDKKDDKVFLFSKYILDLKNFNDEYKEISWKDCSLRKWLNDEFYKEAFSNVEKRKILDTTNVNKGYKKAPLYDTKDGDDTVDKVFLLSQDEVNTYFENGGIYDSERFKKSQIERYGVYVPRVDNATSKATDYVINKYMEYYGIVDKEELEDALNYAFHKDKGSVFDYWLRNFAKLVNNNDNKAAVVAHTGYLTTFQYDKYSLSGVRPAIWVSLN